MKELLDKINKKILHYFDVLFLFLKKYSIPTFRFILITIKHKIFIIVANYKYNVKCSIIRLILHDMSKFRLFKETIWYGINFYGKDKNSITSYDEYMFDRAWLHHQNHNDHHYEYWVDTSGARFSYIPMTEICVREMLCDWIGSCRAYDNYWPKVENNNIKWKWLNENIKTVFNHCHEDTKELIIKVIAECFDGFVIDSENNDNKKKETKEIEYNG